MIVVNLFQKQDDEYYGGLAGQLSAAVIPRNKASSNEYWTSTRYDGTVPTEGLIKVTDRSGTVYIVEKTLN